MENLLEASDRHLRRLLRAGHWGEVERLVVEGLERHPSWVLGWRALGACRESQGRLEEAVAAFRQSLALVRDQPGMDADVADAAAGLGGVLYSLRRFAEAAELCRTAIASAPRHPLAHNTLGAVMLAEDRVAEAIRSFASAAQSRPRFVDAWCNLGMAFRQAGQLGEALVAFDRVLALDPLHGHALSSSLFTRQLLCHDWAGLPEAVLRVRRCLRGPSPRGFEPFGLLALPGLDASDQRTSASLFAAGTLGASLGCAPVGAGSLAGRGRLRVGYVSHDFREHPVCQLVVGVLERHDRGRFEVFAYSHGPDDGSAFRARSVSACETFRDVRGLTDRAIARCIADDRVELLVDLGGYTTGARPAILALRPAPVQVSWLGYPGTLGHPRLADYLIGDAIVTPAELASGYSETLALMPHCYQPNAPAVALLEPVSRIAEGLPESGFVFCCFNQSFKITPEAYDAWCGLLREVPGSVLWLMGPSHVVAVRNLFREADARGISADRIVFAKRKPLDQHLARLQLADLCVDTYPYSSHTTGSDALRAGVPLVTRIGRTFASRVAASLLGTMGLPGLVAESWEQYTRIATSLAREPETLGQLKRELAARRTSSPLFDTAGFTRDLEQLYLRMQADHRAGRRALIGPVAS